MYEEQRLCAWRTLGSVLGICHLLALWPLADYLTSQRLSSLTYNMGKIIAPIGVVKIKWDNVVTCFAYHQANHKCLINVIIYWPGKYLVCFIICKRNIKILFFFKEIRNESHDYPHRVAKFPENRNRNRYRDVSPCKYSLCTCIYVCWLILGGRIQWKEGLGSGLISMAIFFSHYHNAYSL